MKKLRLLSLILASSISMSAYAQQTISFATNATYPPFVSKNANGEIIGFGVDMVHAICKKLDAKCQITDTAWDALIPALNSNKYDAVFGGMSIAKKRAKVVDFTESYHQNPATFIIDKAHPLTLTKAGLKTDIIGYQQGNTFKDYIKGVYGNSIQVKAYPSVSLALIDLKAGRINAIMLDKAVAKDLITEDGDQTLTLQGDIYSTKYFGPGSGIAVKKGNNALKDELNTAIDQLKANGTVENLAKKWFA